MTTARSVTAATRAALEGPASTRALLAFLSITHPNLPDPIRVVCDPMSYIWGGETYVGVIFGFRLLTDDDDAPYTELVLPNTDRRIGNAVRNSRDRATVELALIPSTDFDLTADPRQPIGTPIPEYRFRHYQITSIEVDVVQLRGRVELRDYATEPWPGISATASRFPGLFR